MQWEPVIGLEIHTQLKTQSKLFSGSPIAYGASANSQANAIDLAMPGVLPVLNAAVVDMAIKFGLSIHATIAAKSIFARKNYFYPDLPKGYQISQYELPIVAAGYVDIDVDGVQKRIHITRAHLEEDAGKSLHEDFLGMSGIDLNRAGTPLLEIVSEPDLRSAAEACAYMKTIYALVTYLDICDGNLQEGSFRCDANVSIRPAGEKKYGTRTELKNINSFKFVEKAINYEIERQIGVLNNGATIVQETRLYDAHKNETRSMRSKEEANDYRYFPDPDLLPIIITTDMINHVKANMPELPQQKLQRLQQCYQLSLDDAEFLISDKNLACYFEEVVQLALCKPKLAANWMKGELLSACNKANINIYQSPMSPQRLSSLLKRIEDNTLSSKTAKTVFDLMWSGTEDVDVIIQQQGLNQVVDISAIDKIIDALIAANPAQFAELQSGKEKIFAFFVGKVMQATQGKANPQQINDLLRRRL